MSAEIWQDLWDQAPRITPTELSAVAEMSAWYARIHRTLLGTRDSGQLHHPRETMGP